MTAPEPRPGLRKVEPYASPQIDVPVRLNTNECPRPLPQAFTDDLVRAIGELTLNRYPDGQMTELREELAARAAHPLEGTWAANGSNEVLDQLLLAYGGIGHKAILFEPTYQLHARLIWLTHTEPIRFKIEPPYTIGAKEVAASVSMRPHVVITCSPNNPTGNAQPLDAIKRLAEATSALVIVDEAYIEFGGETALPLVADHPNLVVVRTLSKAFAIAGARVGYCLAAPEVVEDLQRVRLPYHMPALSQAAGLTALRHAEEATAILDDIRKERDRIVDALQAIPGMKVFRSDANFVLFVPPKPSKKVWQGLLDRGVLVRDLTTVVPNALRVTAGATEEVDRFLQALSEVLA